MTNSVPQHRNLRTALPGPRSLALHKRRTESVSAGAGTLAAIYMDHGSGAILVDVDGNQLIDLGSGIGVTSVLRLLPSVVISAELIDDAATVIEDSLAALSTVVPE